MKNNKLFQYVVMGAFIFFLIIGAILFATYKSKDGSNTNISITVWGTLPADLFQPFYSQYFNENELKYMINYVEKGEDTFDRDLVEALASGSGPDAIILPQDLILRYANKIYTIPYTVLPELAFKQTFIQEGELFLNSNGVMALPFMVDPLVMYWNRDIFNNAGVTKPPANWTEIANLVPKMTQKDQAQNIVRSTVALGEYRNVNNAKDILSAMIIQAGNPIVAFGSEGKFVSTLKEGFSSAFSPAVSAMQYYTNFSNPSKREYSWNRSLTNSLDSFANGDLAIYFGFASEYIKLKAKNPNLNFDVTFLPQITGAKTYNTFGNMLGLAIMKNSSNPAGTYTVVTALTSAQAFPYWTGIFNLPSARRDVLGQTERSAVKTIFNQSAVMSKGWYDPNASKTNIIFQDMVESYTTGRDTLESVITTASDRIDSIISNNI